MEIAAASPESDNEWDNGMIGANAGNGSGKKAINRGRWTKEEVSRVQHLAS